MVSFGHYPEISLQLARQKRDEARELIKQKIDPQAFKAQIILQEQNEINNTFKNIAADWFKIKSAKGLTAETLKRILASLENHVFPFVGEKPISQLKAKDFIDALELVHAKGNFDILRRIIQHINEVMFYAVNIGLIAANPAARINAAFESPKTENMPAIKPSELPEFIRALSLVRIELQTRSLIEWQLLTMTRPNKAVSAMWSEIDFTENLWTIPAVRMKMRRERVIPTFVAPYDKPVNASSASVAIKRMGYQGRLVAHGLRSIASTALNEEGFPPDVIEASLAHVDKNAVRRAYNRATYFEPHKKMMQFRGDFVESASLGSVSLSGN